MPPKRQSSKTGRTRPRVAVGKRKDEATPEELLERRDLRRAIALDVFARISEGELVREACAHHKIHRRTLRAWIEEDYEYLYPRYAYAREESADAMFEEAQAIAHGLDTLGMTVGELAELRVDESVAEDKRANAYRVLDSNQIQRDRLRVDTLKWAAAKRNPRTYGDKLDLTSAGQQLVVPVVALPDLAPRHEPTDAEFEILEAQGGPERIEPQTPPPPALRNLLIQHQVRL